jgi:epsilon-lactone hydrolase
MSLRQVLAALSRRGMHATVAAVLLVAHAPLHAAQARADESATATMPATALPYSRFASPQARAKFAELLAETREGKGPDPADLADQRRFYQRYNDDRLREVERAYRSRVQSTRMGGVPVQVVDPEGGAHATTRIVY